MADFPPPIHPRRLLITYLAISVAALVWAYWTTLTEIAERWNLDPQYSHGYLVPVFSLFLLWTRRDLMPTRPLQPSWTGAWLLLIGIGTRLAGAFFNFIWLDEISLLPCLAGVVYLLGGSAAWRWAWPAVAFLVFMIPLPYRFGLLMAGQLRHLATLVSTFLLQCCGIPALADGNRILLNDLPPLDVAEACSGLRMLVVFFALTVGLAFIIQRPLWEKLLIIATAVPIALVTNVIRITATGICWQLAGKAAGKALFHDMAGWLMMPIGLALLWAVLQLLNHLLIEPAGDARRVAPLNALGRA